WGKGSEEAGGFDIRAERQIKAQPVAPRPPYPIDPWRAPRSVPDPPTPRLPPGEAADEQLGLRGGGLMPITQSRRRFLTKLALTGAAGLIRARPALAAEGPLETTTVRLSKDLAICEAPLEIAEELLRAEGFTDVRYVNTSADDLSAAIGDRKVD